VEPEGLTSIADAFAVVKAEAAPAEAGGASLESAPQGEPPATPEVEQPTEPTLDGVKQELVNELLPSDTADEGTPPAPGSSEFWNQSVEVNTVNGTQQVPLGQLRDGFLRQADYTRKTQEIAAMRSHLGDATEFLEQYQNDPAGFARAIAVEQGLIYQGDKPVAEARGIKAPTQKEIDQRVEQLVSERVQSDPAVQEALTIQAHTVIDTEFNRLEQEHHIQLSPDIRESITREAVERNVPDFDLLLRARLASVADQQRQTGQLQGAAPSRPGMSPGAAQAAPEASPPITSIQQAWEQASLEQSQLT
jgi:hypothetical protein